jgi:hypothetical protein
MPRPFRRCGECESLGSPYCEHRGVLRLWLDHGGVQLYVKGSSEESARRAADRVRMKWKGKPFRTRNESGVPEPGARSH